MSSVVQSLGNSWIICRSKTFGGRVYYFNTLTGEAAWNLSESEIEKAKSSTQSNFNLDNCPEPTELPQDFLHKPKTPDPNVICPKIYNKQMINNRFSKQGNILATQLPHYPVTTINPLQFNIPISASFNPSLWNVSTQPILVTSINQPQNVINSNVSIEEIVPSRTSIPLSRRFQNFKEVNVRNTQERRVFNRKFNNRYNHVVFKKSNSDKNQNEKPYIQEKDLRLLLSSKRRNYTAQGHRNEHHNEEAGTSMQTPLKKSSYVICSNIEDDKDNEQRAFKFLDTTYLKTILQVNTTDMWYVITDSNILLNHVDFLCALLKTDSQCRLIILQSVMNKIRNATKTRFCTLAHHSARFISEKLDEKLAILVEEITEENVQDKYEMIDCCTKFLNQDVHVIVLTDDIDIHCYDITIPIYTLRELLKILNTRTSETKPKSPESIVSPRSRCIKITIPNDTSNVNYQKDVANNQESNTGHQTTIDKENELLLESPYEEALAEKTIDDVGVQADTVQVPKIDKNVEDKSTDTFMTNMPIDDKLNDSCVVESHSIEPKKHFTWHKRRHKHRQMSEKSECFSEDSQYCQSNATNHEENRAPMKELSNPADRQMLEASECSSENSQYCQSNATNHEEYSAPMKELSNPADWTDDYQTNIIKQGESVAAEEISNVMQCNLEPNQPECLNTARDKDIHETCSVINKIMTVEETSAILHTESIKNTLSEEDSFNEKTKKKEVVEDKNVMFEVTSEAMEEYLRMKSDEWISRFIQIMEEALTQVLQTDPPYILETMPPPWNIYEGVQCVKRKFSSDCDVIDASNKLSDILFESGGLRGKIKIDLSPYKYMEMYSYGVYLIDALQGVLNDNEDLQIAAESLAKLLNDIEDPHFDQTNQDSFADTENQISDIQENISNENREPEVESVAPAITNTSFTIPENSSKTTTNSEIHSSPSTKYNLRSHRRNNIQENEETPRQVTFIRNIDLESSFFSSLDLKKNLSENKIEAGRKSLTCESASNLISDKTQFDTEEMYRTINSTGMNENEAPAVEPKISEPKIIRNFTKCLEFEEKLKNNISEQNDYQESTIPSETDYGNEELDYEVEDEYYYHNNYDYNDTEFHEYTDEDHFINDDFTYETDNVSFQSVFYKIKDHLKNEFQSIHRFCENSYAVLSTSHSDVEKSKIKVEAEETYLHLNNLCEELHSIIERETSDSAYRIQNVFTLGENLVDEEDLENYKSFIGKCLEQGNILKEAIELVVEACLK